MSAGLKRLPYGDPAVTIVSPALSAGLKPRAPLITGSHGPAPGVRPYVAALTWTKARALHLWTTSLAASVVPTRSGHVAVVRSDYVDGVAFSPPVQSTG